MTLQGKQCESGVNFCARIPAYNTFIVHALRHYVHWGGNLANGLTVEVKKKLRTWTTLLLTLMPDNPGINSYANKFIATNRPTTLSPQHLYWFYRLLFMHKGDYIVDQTCKLDRHSMLAVAHSSKAIKYIFGRALYYLLSQFTCSPFLPGWTDYQRIIV